MLIFGQINTGTADLSSAIDTSEVVEIGGINQFITLKGNDQKKPLLLFLHGGPGKSLIGVAETFNDELIDHFVVIHWDQRESGKTLEMNTSNEELTYEILQSDTYELIQYLLNKFNRKKLYLASHSWGSVLGFHIAQNYPELLHAYIPISPIVHQAEHTALTIKMLKKWAWKNDNKTAIKELNTVNIPLQTQDDLFYQQKWLFIYNGADFATKPGFREEYYDWMAVWFPVVIRSFQNNLFETVPELNCPIYFLEGRGDKQKSHYVANRYYKKLDTDFKKFYWFEDSGHTIFNTEPKKLQETIIEIAKQPTP